MDPRFFRRYIDILFEASPASNNQDLPELVNNMIQLFRNLIGRADSKDRFLTINFHTLNGYLSNLKSKTINYDEFKNIYDQYDQIKSLVKNFDKDDITLYTKKESPEETPVSSEDEGDKEVDKMAKRSLKRRGLR